MQPIVISYIKFYSQYGKPIALGTDKIVCLYAFFHIQIHVITCTSKMCIDSYILHIQT